MMNIQITGLLHRLGSGSRDAIDELMPLVYTELKKLARGICDAKQAVLPSIRLHWCTKPF
ncbi:MAG: hypothetical protein JO217_08305 [Acidobacteriaceae bacterium]|nr:hypothetical protein [Acidobacteriaceae bacterium]